MAIPQIPRDKQLNSIGSTDNLEVGPYTTCLTYEDKIDAILKSIKDENKRIETLNNMREEIEQRLIKKQSEKNDLKDKMKGYPVDTPTLELDDKTKSLREQLQLQIDVISKKIRILEAGVLHCDLLISHREMHNGLLPWEVQKPTQSKKKKKVKKIEQDKTKAVYAEFINKYYDGGNTLIKNNEGDTNVWSGRFGEYDIRYELKADGTLTKKMRKAGKAKWTVTVKIRKAELTIYYESASIEAKSTFTQRVPNAGKSSKNKPAGVKSSAGKPSAGQKTIQTKPAPQTGASPNINEIAFSSKNIDVQEIKEDKYGNLYANDGTPVRKTPSGYVEAEHIIPSSQDYEAHEEKSYIAEKYNYETGQWESAR